MWHDGDGWYGGADWGVESRTCDPPSHPHPQQSNEWPLLAAINQLII